VRTRTGTNCREVPRHSRGKLELSLPFEGTAQVQRLVISRMERGEYRQRLDAAVEVLQPL
jgi:hypothetical protein